MPNRWIEFVKEFAAKNNISYGCALGKPELKSQYYAKYPKKGSEKKMPEPEPEPEVIEIVPVKKKRVKKAKAKPMLEELPDLEDITDLEDLPSFKKKGSGTSFSRISPEEMKSHISIQQAENIGNKLKISGFTPKLIYFIYKTKKDERPGVEPTFDWNTEYNKLSETEREALQKFNKKSVAKQNQIVGYINMLMGEMKGGMIVK